MTASSNSPDAGSGILSLARWIEQTGITPVTAWRWRRKGWLTTINIAGRQYVTQAAQQEFARRASAGEFAKEHQVPTPRKA